MEFFQNDFAGRVAAKMMQTSLGVRDAVIKVTEVLLYVTVYFTGAMVLFATSDLRLTAPMLLWLAGYILDDALLHTAACAIFPWSRRRPVPW